MKNLFNTLSVFIFFAVFAIISEIQAIQGNTVSEKDRIMQSCRTLAKEQVELTEFIGDMIAVRQKKLENEFREFARRNQPQSNANIKDVLDYKNSLIKRQLKHLKIIKDALLHDGRD